MKVGDEVKVVTEWSTFHGCVGTVEEIDQGYNLSHNVKFHCGDDGWCYFSEDELEKLE